MITIWANEGWHDAILQRPKELINIHSYWGGCISLGFRLQQELGDDDPNVCFTLEGQTDLQASTLLIISGYARNANALLRGWLENIFLGAWFSVSGTIYTKWKNKEPDRPFKDRTIFKEKFVRELLSKPYFKQYNEKFDLMTRLLDLYRDLSIDVHAQDMKTHNTTTWNDSVARFRPELFDKWYVNMISVFEIMNIVVFLRYPNILTAGSSEVNEIQELLSPKTVADIRSTMMTKRSRS